jgi:hypothetical protein
MQQFIESSLSQYIQLKLDFVRLCFDYRIFKGILRKSDFGSLNTEAVFGMQDL